MNFASIATRLRLSVARAILQIINDGSTLQTMQIQLQKDVVRDNVERFQQYGYTSVPFAGAEGVAVAVGGSTDHFLLISVDDRRYRLKGLKPGEVALYDDLGQVVHLTREGIIIRGAGKPVKITDTPLINLDADVQISGGISVQNSTETGNHFAGDVNFTGDSVKHNDVEIGAAHKHGGVVRGGEVSDPPVGA